LTVVFVEINLKRETTLSDKTILPLPWFAPLKTQQNTSIILIYKTAYIIMRM